MKRAIHMKKVKIIHLLNQNQLYHQIFLNKDQSNHKVEQFPIPTKVKIHQIFKIKKKILKEVNHNQSRKKKKLKNHKRFLRVQILAVPSHQVQKFKVRIVIWKVKWMILLLKINQLVLTVHQVRVLFLNNLLKKRI